MNNQQEAFDKLSRLKVGALFMEMGTGKTKVALDLINYKKSKVEYVLWICPFSIKKEIEREKMKWYPSLDVDIVGCESIGSSDRIYLKIYQKVKEHKSFIVVDESLKIKNKDAKRTKRIIELGKLSEYRLILNGTPVSKNVLDLWTQMDFLSPKILNMSYLQFKNTYCEYYIRGRLRGLVKAQYNIEHLISLISPYIYDCELEIESKKRYVDINYSMSVSEKEDYDALKENYFGSFYNFDFMALSQTLQHHYCKAQEKSERLLDVLNKIDGKVIVFVKYLESIPEGVLRLVGEMNTNERAEAIEQFRDKEKVLFVTYGCGTFGLNLQFCKNIIFAEHTFDYAERLQAEARIYRMGQESDVVYYNLWCNVGLENLIKKSLHKKSNLLYEIKNEINKKGEEEWLKSI